MYVVHIVYAITPCLMSSIVPQNAWTMDRTERINAWAMKLWLHALLSISDLNSTYNTCLIRVTKICFGYFSCIAIAKEISDLLSCCRINMHCPKSLRKIILNR